MDVTLTGSTTPGQSGPGSNINEGVIHTLQGAEAKYGIIF